MAKKGINKVIVMGNLGQDPEVRYMPNGDAVANCSIATSESWKDSSGQQKEKTEWHRVVFYRKLAEIVGEYVKKGSRIYIEGKLQTRKWQAQDGSDRYSTEIICNEMQMLGDNRSNDGSSQKPTQQSNQYRNKDGSAKSPQQMQADNGPPMDFDDDIPF